MMLFPSPSTCKVMKGAPNHVPMNMIGFAYTSLKILEGGDFPMFPVVLITPNHMVYPKATCRS